MEIKLVSGSYGWEIYLWQTDSPYCATWPDRIVLLSLLWDQMRYFKVRNVFLESQIHEKPQCPYAGALWSQLLREFGITWVWPFDCLLVFQHVSGIGYSGIRRKTLWNTTVLALCWALWMERNKRVFDTKWDLNSTWDRVRFWVALWVLNTNDLRDFSFSDLIRDWCPFLMF